METTKLVYLSEAGYVNMTPEYFKLKAACKFKIEEEELANEVTRQTFILLFGVE